MKISINFGEIFHTDSVNSVPRKIRTNTLIYIRNYSAENFRKIYSIIVCKHSIYTLMYKKIDVLKFTSGYKSLITIRESIDFFNIMR